MSYNWIYKICSLYKLASFSSVQFSSVAQLCLTLCDPMNCSMPGLPVQHQLPEFTQNHVHQVSDAIQPSHPLSSPLLLPSIPPNIRVFSSESTLRMRWPKYLSHLLFDHFQFALIHGPNIPGSYAILLFIASDLASITGHIHKWVLFLLWLHPFILSGAVSPLTSSSILGTNRPREFLFQYPIILHFHTLHGVLKVRIPKWFAIPFSSGPHSVRPLHHDPPVLSGPTQHGLVSLN